MLVVAALAMSACASTTPEPTAAPSPEAPPSAEVGAGEPKQSAPTAKLMPTACASRSAGECVPPPAFANAMCDGDYPTAALALFAPRAPWQRAYLTRKTRAWNASGGASSNEELALDEEVVIVRVREPATGGIVVSGAGRSYDAVRWDGACVTLSSDEVTTARKPGRPRYARVQWKRLDLATRDVLRQDTAVDDAYRAVRKECKGVSLGAVSKACETADGKLVDAVVAYVRTGAELPPPKDVP